MSTITIQPGVLTSGRITRIRLATLRGLPELPLYEAHQRKMVLACYGPSLKDTWHRINPDDDVFTVSGAHDFLIERGITPKAHIECDPRAHKAKFLANARDGVIYMLASCCHSDTFDAVRGRTTILWHSCQSREEDNFIRATNPNAMLVVGGSTVGNRAICVGTVLGYRNFEVHGMDCSFAGTPSAKPKVEDFVQHAGAHVNEVSEIFNAKEINKVPLRRHYATSSQMLGAMKDFVDLVHQTQDCKYVIHGDSLLSAALEALNLPRVSMVDGHELISRAA